VSSFGHNIRPHIDSELQHAAEAESCGNAARAFAHLERAHVLGQSSTAQHIRVHWHMFTWGLRHQNVRECLGQVMRIVGAATKTAFGLVPTGNTGGSNISPFKPLPVPSELAAILRSTMTTAKVCEVPLFSSLRQSLSTAYFYDCYVIELPPDDRSPLELYLSVASKTPLWIEILMNVRNKIVAQI
jgi:hypothetical protein